MSIVTEETMFMKARPVMIVIRVEKQMINRKF